MANESQVAMLRRSVDEWNSWRRDHSETPVLLDGAMLIGVELSGADLNRAELAEARLTASDLSGADLREATLRGATLANTRLCKADLTRAKLLGVFSMGSDLTEANLQNCSLMASSFWGCRLDGANLTGADLQMTVFNGASLAGTRFHSAELLDTGLLNVDLSDTEGLDDCRHLGPSNIDHLTLQRSKGLSVAFLRGCGLPESFVNQVLSFDDSVSQFHSCFISYSSFDHEFAARLHGDLQRHGIRCWFAPHDVVGGRKLREQIGDAVQEHDRLLLILSARSMSSEWVKTEIASARQKELRFRRQVLFPISIVPYELVREWDAFDSDTGKDSAREVREYYIPDFTGWDADNGVYEVAFDKLLKGLKAVSASKKPLAP